MTDLKAQNKLWFGDENVYKSNGIENFEKFDRPIEVSVVGERKKTENETENNRFFFC